MNRPFKPLISEEELGAFLEGNISDSESTRIRNLISFDESLKEILEINDIVDDDILSISESPFQFNDEIVDINTFELPIIETYYSIDSLDSESSEVDIHIPDEQIGTLYHSETDPIINDEQIDISNIENI